MLKKWTWLAFVAENQRIMFMLAIAYSLDYVFSLIPNSDNHNHYHL